MATSGVIWAAVTTMDYPFGLWGEWLGLMMRQVETGTTRQDENARARVWFLADFGKSVIPGRGPSPRACGAPE
jgi:hypothetical protein